MAARPVRILVVEDDETLGNRLTALVTGGGLLSATATTASSLAAALRRATEEAFDVVLLDLTLPDCTGFDVAARFHAAAPGLPFIVLTEDDNDPVAIQALQVGAQDILHKGVDGAALVMRAVRYAIERHELLTRLNQSLSDARTSETNLRSVLTHSADGIVVLDHVGTVVFANPAAHVLLGKDDAPLTGLSGSQFPYPVSPGDTWEVEVGQAFIEVRGVSLEWERRPASLITLRDLTDKKRALDLQLRLIHADRLAVIGQLAAGVAHEVNNPAAFIVANQTMVRASVQKVAAAIDEIRGQSASDPESTRRDRVLGILSKAAVDENLTAVFEMLDDNTAGMDRIRSVVQDLRTFSRIDASDVEEVQLAEVIDAACAMVSNEVRHRARLSVDVGPLPPLAGDRGKLAQVLMNLLLNATQAIEGGAADQNYIRVSARLLGSLVVLSVEDSGAGMTDEVRARAFEPFFTTKPREVGTGLGLSLCADIVRKHGGEIRVASAPGKGSRFDVLLPVHSSLVSAKAVATEPPREAPVAAARILIIDDEPTLLNAYRRMLAPPHDVTLAKGGAEGLSLLAEQGPFDLVLCDLMMPDVDGVEVYERIQETAASMLDRLVFCTGGAFTPRAKEFMMKIPNTFLLKPVTRPQLLGLIADFVTKE